MTDSHGTIHPACASEPATGNSTAGKWLSRLSETLCKTVVSISFQSLAHVLLGNKVFECRVKAGPLGLIMGKTLRPSRVLSLYYLITFMIGVALTFPVARWVAVGEIGARGSAILTLCWNVLFIMLLPLILDWAERRYCKARFVELEEVARANPELALVISEHCKKLSLPGLRLAVIDTNSDELFSYGLWRSNPRLIIPNALLNVQDRTQAIPSIEAELSRFAHQDHTLVFLLFTALQCIIQQLIIVSGWFA